MILKILVVVLIVSVVINLAAVLTFGFYWWNEGGPKRGIPPRGMEEGPDWRASRLGHRLNLTEEQIKTMDAGREEMRSKTSALRGKLSEKRKELTALLRESELDRARADALFEEIATLQTELEVLAFEKLRDISKILTPEQREQFLELYERRLRMRPGSREGRPERRMEDRRGRGREGGKMRRDDR